MQFQGRREPPFFFSRQPLKVAPLLQIYTYQRQHNSRKDSDEIETPPPPDRARHLPHHHRRYKRAAEKCKIGHRHPLPALMHAV